MLSEGRAWLGIGAGSSEQEARGLGLPFPPAGQRFERLEEALQICLQMWSDDDGPYAGKHYRLGRTLNSPQPLTRPHPPILIGGTGERVLLKLVARHADMWNASASAPRMRELIDLIRRHGDTVGRDTDQIEKTVLMPLCYRATAERRQFMCQLIAGMRQTTPENAREQIMIGEKQECLDCVERYVSAGVTHFIFMTMTPFQLDEIQAFAEEVIPAVRGA